MVGVKNDPLFSKTLPNYWKVVEDGTYFSNFLKFCLIFKNCGKCFEKWFKVFETVIHYQN